MPKTYEFKDLFEEKTEEPKEEKKEIRKKLETTTPSKSPDSHEGSPYTHLKLTDLELTDLITAVDQYLRTYNNPQRKIKSGGIVDRRNIRMQKLFKKLNDNF